MQEEDKEVIDLDTKDTAFECKTFDNECEPRKLLESLKEIIQEPSGSKLNLSGEEKANFVHPKQKLTIGQTSIQR